jgi:hypothetical protein
VHVPVAESAYDEVSWLPILPLITLARQEQVVDERDRALR